MKVIIVGSLRDREVACSASDRQGSNFESCVWRAVSSQSSHHPQEVLLAQFSLYVHKGGPKPDSILFISDTSCAVSKNYLFIAVARPKPHSSKFLNVIHNTANICCIGASVFSNHIFFLSSSSCQRFEA